MGRQYGGLNGPALFGLPLFGPCLCSGAAVSAGVPEVVPDDRRTHLPSTPREVRATDPVPGREQLVAGRSPAARGVLDTIREDQLTITGRRSAVSRHSSVIAVGRGPASGSRG
ncbi:hypothetical protein FDG2_5470 [Candidatus Protofrankia californiensis]|uniref:Uncharacterized protein n=1 Tax=Candidatus Protofrankia californiensis TaxID=1839754 RepID=A0A1C3PDP7_9ACTN|nr:hypothetical protein FDG2_5470 [Candidatus Protofrankia californiensis]